MGEGRGLGGGGGSGTSFCWKIPLTLQSSISTKNKIFQIAGHVLETFKIILLNQAANKSSLFRRKYKEKV